MNKILEVLDYKGRRWAPYSAYQELSTELNKLSYRLFEVLRVEAPFAFDGTETTARAFEEIATLLRNRGTVNVQRSAEIAKLQERVRELEKAVPAAEHEYSLPPGKIVKINGLPYRLLERVVVAGYQEP